MNCTVILGAGFSKNSGLPLQSEIPALLVEKTYNDEFENAVTRIIKNFMKDVFGFRQGNLYPNLDDMLTCIDIATKSGHHLGIKYSPLHLRAVRRFLVYRVFSILDGYYQYSKEVEELISKLNTKFETVSYVVLNWDTVLENYINLTGENVGIDYCNSGILKPLKANNSKAGKNIKVIKVHGSCNWLYCDNCRVLVNDINKSVGTLQKAGFKKLDFLLFDELLSLKDIKDFIGMERCPVCENIVSSHIASWEYRKSFRDNSFPDLWNSAEDELSNSDKWLFIGYSMPQADYEFKHLLKVSELKLNHKTNKKLSIDVVILNSNTTKGKYESLFGDRIKNICNGGVGEYVRFL